MLLATESVNTKCKLLRNQYHKIKGDICKFDISVYNTFQWTHLHSNTNHLLVLTIMEMQDQYVANVNLNSSFVVYAM